MQIGCGSKRVVRVPGVAAAARLFGVTKGHLFRVVVGDRKSPKLLQRYNDFLKTRQGGGIKTHDYATNWDGAGRH